MTLRQLATITVFLLAACMPPRVKELNQLGQQAVAAHRYDQAVDYFSESLAIYPDQPKIALQLESSKTMLKQAYVFKVYELVDGPKQPIAGFLQVWQVAKELPKLGVPAARVISIRKDLDNAFAKHAPRLKQTTEPHDLFLHLRQMEQLLSCSSVSATRAETASSLQQLHLAAQKKADGAGRAGLALLHTAAAATFAPGDTGLWVEVRRRQQALRAKLGIHVALAAQSALGGAVSRHLLGGIRRRLPKIFIVDAAAALRLSLRAGRPSSHQGQVPDRRSAKCQVATRREKNPACESLTRRAEMARRDYERRLSALQTAEGRCSSAQQASACTSYLSSARRDVSSAKRSFEQVEQQVGRCPQFIEKPVFKTFFYNRYTMTRSADISGTVTVSRGQQVVGSRAVRGSVSQSDSYGDGLSCARIAPDPLNLPSLSSLASQAQERLLNGSLHELLRLRRQLAERQLAGADGEDARLDALVRARIVDESWRQVSAQLGAHLKQKWTSDFKLPVAVVR